jgi:thiamine pyrophosphate-dependent acetolactate synthase large subunit-like protein
MNDLYPAMVALVADAAPAAAALASALGDGAPVPGGAETAARLRAEIAGDLTPSEERHTRLLRALRPALPPEAMVMGDACQLTYTGAFHFPVEMPKRWHYGAGYCPLGYALPNAIGAKLAQPERPVLAIAGDGGAMFTIQELVTAAELRLPIPLILWENGGLKQIQDDMRAGNVPRVGVDGINPDFLALARAMHCHAEAPGSLDMFAGAVTYALAADRPTLILVHEEAEWLQ